VPLAKCQDKSCLYCVACFFADASHRNEDLMIDWLQPSLLVATSKTLAVSCKALTSHLVLGIMPHPSNPPPDKTSAAERQ
jgi:hypothetical protein